ncbi:MAG TPA: hypothetical protein VI796_06145, partial [Candidatus Thermoplasmatota archaeon]|nr:hypothetical protein [Candidatus Thermoplasmatota archaeon]
MQALDFTPALAQTYAAQASHQEALDLLTPFLDAEGSRFTKRQLASAALLIPTDPRGSFRRAAMRLRRRGRRRTPSADTLKRRLHAPQTTVIEAFMRDECRKILSKSLRHNEARRGYDLIGDTTCHGHYGQAMANIRADRDDPQYVSRPLSTSLARTATG